MIFYIHNYFLPIGFVCAELEDEVRAHLVEFVFNEIKEQYNKLKNNKDTCIKLCELFNKLNTNEILYLLIKNNENFETIFIIKSLFNSQISQLNSSIKNTSDKTKNKQIQDNIDKIENCNLFKIKKETFQDSIDNYLETRSKMNNYHDDKGKITYAFFNFPERVVTIENTELFQQILTEKYNDQTMDVFKNQFQFMKQKIQPILINIATENDYFKDILNDYITKNKPIIYLAERMLDFIIENVKYFEKILKNNELKQKFNNQLKIIKEKIEQHSKNNISALCDIELNEKLRKLIFAYRNESGIEEILNNLIPDYFYIVEDHGSIIMQHPDYTHIPTESTKDIIVKSFEEYNEKFITKINIYKMFEACIDFFNTDEQNTFKKIIEFFSFLYKKSDELIQEKTDQPLVMIIVPIWLQYVTLKNKNNDILDYNALITAITKVIKMHKKPNANFYPNFILTFEDFSTIEITDKQKHNVLAFITLIFNSIDSIFKPKEDELLNNIKSDFFINIYFMFLYLVTSKKDMRNLCKEFLTNIFVFIDKTLINDLLHIVGHRVRDKETGITKHIMEFIGGLKTNEAIMLIKSLCDQPFSNEFKIEDHQNLISSLFGHNIKTFNKEIIIEKLGLLFGYDLKAILKTEETNIKNLLSQIKNFFDFFDLGVVSAFGAKKAFEAIDFSKYKKSNKLNIDTSDKNIFIHIIVSFFKIIHVFNHNFSSENFISCNILTELINVLSNIQDDQLDPKLKNVDPTIKILNKIVKELEKKENTNLLKFLRGIFNKENIEDINKFIENIPNNINKLLEFNSNEENPACFKVELYDFSKTTKVVDTWFKNANNNTECPKITNKLQSEWFCEALSNIVTKDLKEIFSEDKACLSFGVFVLSVLLSNKFHTDNLLLFFGQKASIVERLFNNIIPIVISTLQFPEATENQKKIFGGLLSNQPQNTNTIENIYVSSLDFFIHNDLNITFFVNNILYLIINVYLFSFDLHRVYAIQYIGEYKENIQLLLKYILIDHLVDDQAQINDIFKLLLFLKLVSNTIKIQCSEFAQRNVILVIANLIYKIWPTIKNTMINRNNEDKKDYEIFIEYLETNMDITISYDKLLSIINPGVLFLYKHIGLMDPDINSEYQKKCFECCFKSSTYSALKENTNTEFQITKPYQKITNGYFGGNNSIKQMESATIILCSITYLLHNLGGIELNNFILKLIASGRYLYYILNIIKCIPELKDVEFTISNKSILEHFSLEYNPNKDHFYPNFIEKLYTMSSENGQKSKKLINTIKQHGPALYTTLILNNEYDLNKGNLDSISDQRCSTNVLCEINKDILYIICNLIEKKDFLLQIISNFIDIDKNNINRILALFGDFLKDINNNYYQVDIINFIFNNKDADINFNSNKRIFDDNIFFPFFIYFKNEHAIKSILTFLKKNPNNWERFQQYIIKSIMEMLLLNIFSINNPIFLNSIIFIINIFNNIEIFIGNKFKLTDDYKEDYKNIILFILKTRLNINTTDFDNNLIKNILTKETTNENHYNAQKFHDNNLELMHKIRKLNTKTKQKYIEFSNINILNLLNMIQTSFVTHIFNKENFDSNNNITESETTNMNESVISLLTVNFMRSEDSTSIMEHITSGQFSLASLLVQNPIFIKKDNNSNVIFNKKKDSTNILYNILNYLLVLCSLIFIIYLGFYIYKTYSIPNKNNQDISLEKQLVIQNKEEKEEIL